MRRCDTRCGSSGLLEVEERAVLPHALHDGSFVLVNQDFLALGSSHTGDVQDAASGL
jgi:hypothetical protein